MVIEVVKGLPPVLVARAVLTELIEEVYPREGEMISGKEMYEHVREYFGADEIDVHAFPIDWLLDSLTTDDVERLVVAGLVNGMLYIAYRRAFSVLPDDVEADYTYHALAALRVRIECRHSELVGESPSVFRVKIN